MSEGQFISYPTNRIVAVVDDDTSASAATDNLIQALGLGPDEVTVLCGPEGARTIDPSGEHHGLIARIIRLVQFTTMDGDHAQRYADEAAAGHCVVLVHLADDNQIQAAREILNQHGGHFINWYARFHFETLDD
jgi:FixJ family two-component response regulator